MNKYEKAAEDINALLKKGIKYAEALKPVIPMLKSAEGNIFIYWNPETGHYAIKPARKDEQIEKDAAVGFYKAGFAMKADFDNAACEENGWVCLYGPNGYKPLKKLKKYASVIENPGKLAITGALLTGGALGTYKMLRPDEDDDTLSKKLKKALKVFALGGAIGAIPGIASGIGNYMLAKDLSFRQAMAAPYGKLEEWSPTYGKQMQYERDMAEFKKNLIKMKDKVEETRPYLRKESAFNQGSLFNTGVVKVDAFNRLTWDAAKDGSLSMPNAVLTNSILNASSQRAGSGLVSPANIAGTLINAGIGYATSALIGKTLGAMGMVSPAGQEKLREIGTWGGVLQSINNTIRY